MLKFLGMLHSVNNIMSHNSSHSYMYMCNVMYLPLIDYKELVSVNRSFGRQ